MNLLLIIHKETWHFCDKKRLYNSYKLATDLKKKVTNCHASSQTFVYILDNCVISKFLVKIYNSIIQ